MSLDDRDRNEPWLVAQELGNHLGKVVQTTADGVPARGNPLRRPDFAGASRLIV